MTTTTRESADVPTLLLVDDAAEIRGLLRTLVEVDGRFRVVGEAGDGREALEIAARSCPDAVLLDLTMPVMCGLEALPLLRSQCPRAAIVVHSSTPGSGVRRRARDAGADGYVCKGTSPDTLVDELRAVLDRRTA